MDTGGLGRPEKDQNERPWLFREWHSLFAPAPSVILILPIPSAAHCRELVRVACATLMENFLMNSSKLIIVGGNKLAHFADGNLVLDEKNDLFAAFRLPIDERYLKPLSSWNRK